MHAVFSFYWYMQTVPSDSWRNKNTIWIIAEQKQHITVGVVNRTINTGVTSLARVQGQ